MRHYTGMNTAYGFGGYLDLVADAIDDGERKESRAVLRSTGQKVATRALHARSISFDLRAGFPLLTARVIHAKSVFAELCWMLSGSTNVRDLNKLGSTIWDEWADERGDLGPTYGEQWRGWRNCRHSPSDQHDQIANIVNSLRDDPDSRRHVVSAWNVDCVGQTRLPPCHVMFQASVFDDALDLHVTMRSCDLILGLPYNAAFYAALARLLAQSTWGVEGGDPEHGKCPRELHERELVMTLVDAHVYENHVKGAREMIVASHAHASRPSPKLVINCSATPLNVTPSDFSVEDYYPMPKIAFEVAV